MAANVDESKCDGCGICVDVCPVEAIVIDQIAKIDADTCIDCGACVDECPNNAIIILENEIASSTRNLYPAQPSPIPAIPHGSNPNTPLTSAGQSGVKQENKSGLLGQVFDFFRKSAGQGRGQKKSGDRGGGRGSGRRGGRGSGHGKGRYGR